ncbi:MAG TPA: hypothetical protein PKD52_08360 [Clostridiales bacterium]|nr:hypothetical protein [Clostridiales bacterium]
MELGIKEKQKKRDCGIKMKIVPYGAGWTDIYLDFAGKQLYFIISEMSKNQFNDLLKILYYLYPDQGDPERTHELIEYKCGICTETETGYKVVKITDDLHGVELPSVVRDIPWKADFTWDEEGAYSDWTLERVPDQNIDFLLKIHIEHHRAETKIYDYEVSYRDFCYAVAKACTEMLKEYGFYGYHYSTYIQDMNIRYLLFLKSVALNDFEARKLTCYDKEGHGETTDLQKELELLLFEM